jgi:hypothetical protein
MATLQAAPYNLDLNDQVIVRIKATNVVGDSANSADNSSAGVIQTIPDQVIGLATGTVDDTQIELSWTALTGDGTGGTTTVNY